MAKSGAAHIPTLPTLRACGPGTAGTRSLRHHGPGPEAARRYGMPTQFEERLLLSPHRPVVLGIRGRPVNERVSSGLSTIGMFLP